MKENRILRQIFSLCFLCSLFFAFQSCDTSKEGKQGKIIGIHILNYTSDSLLNVLGKQLPEISAMGINTIFLEVDYSFEFQSHPELRQGKSFITKKGAEKFTVIAKSNNITIIPQFQSLGHQSWADKTFPLLTVYPELDLTPNFFEDNKNIYCREWDPLNPKVNKIIFPMIDEIVEAFDSKGIHIGLDEVFLIDSVQAATYGLQPSSVFAMVVNQFHDYFTKEKGLELYIWADRLINGEKIKYGVWESSLNNTWQALDSIPNDVILADWHYTDRKSYESVDYFIDKGFRVLPASYNNLPALESFIKYTYALEHDNMLGHMFTTWHRVKNVPDYPPVVRGIEVINSKMYHNVEFTSVAGEEHIEIRLNSKISDIRYSIDSETDASPAFGSEYKNPIIITESAIVLAQPFKGGNAVGDVISAKYLFHKGLAKEISVRSQPSNKYETNKGIELLVDGRLGSRLYDGNWAAFDTNFEATIDLGKPEAFSKVIVRTYFDPDQWILAPKETIILASENGVIFEELHSKLDRKTEGNVNIDTYKTYLTGARYVRVICIQDQMPNKEDAWLFIDEVIIE